MAVSKVPLTVVIDTNFIAVPAQFNIDIFSEAERILERKLEFVVISTALEEIERKLSNPKNKTEARHFKVAKALIDRCKVVGPEGLISEASVDDQILAYAKENNGVLATNDRELKKKARDSGVPVLMLRGKKQLALHGNVL